MKSTLTRLLVSAAEAAHAGGRGLCVVSPGYCTPGGDAQLKATQDLGRTASSAAHPGVKVTVDLDAGTSGGLGRLQHCPAC